MSVDDFSYDQFVLRNAGYIQPATQEKIRNTRLLIAGCGMGSSPAMCAARLGFEKFILVDGDTVDAHNLNRQFYEFADVGKPKVEALKGQILRINPQAEVEAVQAFLDAGNTEAIVGKADIVFDTIDFVDLPAILRLHGAARARGADVFTALNVGFGALVWYFPAGGPLGLSDILAPAMFACLFVALFAGFPVAFSLAAVAGVFGAVGLATGDSENPADIARRFCRLCETSGMAENFDALTGAGLRDRAFAWTSAVYLIFSAWLARTAQGKQE